MPKGRPRVRWEDNVRNDLRKMGVANWKQRMQERKQWKEIIEQAKTHRVVELKEELANLMHKFLFYNKFIIFLYMFRARLCSSSGGQNCIVQHLVS